jgi:hypothetical protein
LGVARCSSYFDRAHITRDAPPRPGGVESRPPSTVPHRPDNDAVFGPLQRARAALVDGVALQ